MTTSLSDARVWSTCAHLARLQQADGMIPWFPGGHCDPWNHVEAAMALTVGGFEDEARAAYRWLARLQHADGSWAAYYRADAPDGIEDHKRDTNVCAYVAAGVLHLLRTTGDRDFARGMWPVVERAIDFVLSVQRPDGELAWCVFGEGEVARSALLTGSASAYHSVRCAVALAEALDHERPDWELAAGRIATAVAFRPDLFEDKAPWAMDWYYPVLCGAVSGNAGRTRLANGWGRFVDEEHGVRCLSTGDWFTGAETAEEVPIAHLVVGEPDKAALLLAAAHRLRAPDGGYFTGVVQPAGRHYPHLECSSYTAAAVVLADACHRGESSTFSIFHGDGLPAGLDLSLASLDL